ncbi:MAG: 2-oxoacid:acceptor oxidoreductase subunit alpha [Calditrichaeota bacterium]|nr:2-oxoacid:acceptor oxidoreductase subunit alpha [Calditrichota bacterium]RQV92166.1 MAG: 2-oxoacid:acceptor oxidoreductase subunit alpha [bacterium]
MPEKAILMQGNEACAEGAIAAGCRFFAGYPITPSTEIAESLSEKLPSVGGKFIQMEDEIGSIGAVLGASVAGLKAMTATSGPGFSLMQEGIGFACMAEIPAVIINVMRGGPSTGLPTKTSQGDIMQARWGTHGDHFLIALIPESVKESFYLTIKAFNLSEKYRVPVILLLDEAIGHMREKIFLPEYSDLLLENRVIPMLPPQWYKPYEVTPDFITPMAPFGTGYRYNITGLTHDEMGFPTSKENEIVANMNKLRDKILRSAGDIVDHEALYTDDANTLVIAYGSGSRSAKEAVEYLRSRRRKVGFFRPITIWPFPEKELAQIIKKVDQVFVVEMNQGQIIDVVRKVECFHKKIFGINRYDGEMITPNQIISKIREAR